MNTIPAYISPKTRTWATVTLVLSALTLVSCLYGFTQIPRSMALDGSRAPLQLILAIAKLVAAIAFLAGSIGVLGARSWGRETLAYTAAAAVVIVVLSTAFQITEFTDPRYATALQTSTAAGMAGNPNAGSVNLPSLIGMMLKIMLWSTAIGGIIQIAYCIFLYRHMSADPEAAPDPYARPEFTPGTWPPPPVG
ncbi:MAG: hypothetical protein ACLQVD_04735 [Capsulimonadaceae bacterium]